MTTSCYFRLHNNCFRPAVNCNIPQMQKIQRPRQFVDNLKGLRIVFEFLCPLIQQFNGCQPFWFCVSPQPCHMNPSRPQLTPPLMFQICLFKLILYWVLFHTIHHIKRCFHTSELSMLRSVWLSLHFYYYHVHLNHSSLKRLLANYFSGLILFIELFQPLIQFI